MKRLVMTLRGDEADVDITPMLDVVFIMLIFFIVTASFVKEAGIGVNNPAMSDPARPESPPIVVNVSELGEIRIQDRVVSSNAVKPTIIRLKAEKPGSTVVVRVDGRASTRSVVEAIDGIRAAKVLLPSVSIANG